MAKLMLTVLLLTCCDVFSQSLKDKLSFAVKALEADSQCDHGMVSLYVLDNKTGLPLFSRNEEIGLAPASTQKTIIAVTAFELLGKNYTYKTNLAYDGKIDERILLGNIIIAGSGDPTLGSWRYAQTKEEAVLANFRQAIMNLGIAGISGQIQIDDHIWDAQVTPDGWIWQDLGNYYGAGAMALNWRENQYDIILRSGSRIGDSVQIISTLPVVVEGVSLKSELTSAAKGSGDNAYIYLPDASGRSRIRGTIPVNEDHFVISGSLPHAGLQLKNALMSQEGLSFTIHSDTMQRSRRSNLVIFYTHASPPLDSIAYWFLKRSVNLYGEALLKTIAFEQKKLPSTDTGVSIIKDFWRQRGIEKTALNIIDGSGLSPENRVTAHALTQVLQYAQHRSWSPSFYHALPEINGIKMKSGSIRGVLCYAGYIKNRRGGDYTFAFMINNFNGNASALRTKMWKLLDILK